MTNEEFESLKKGDRIRLVKQREILIVMSRGRCKSFNGLRSVRIHKAANKRPEYITNPAYIEFVKEEK